MMPLRHDSEFISVRFKARRKCMTWQLFNILRRLAAIAAAIQYVNVSMSATWWALQVLSGAKNPTETLRVFPSSLIEGYVGGGLIQNSSLVQDVLGGDSTPRDYALFLESDTNTSTQNCSKVPRFNSAIYNYDFLNQGFLKMISSTKYNVTVLDDMELVVVVVDCSFRQIVAGDPSSIRTYNLMRSTTDHNHLYLVTISLNVQEYEVRAQHKQGPALVGMLTLVDDMRNSSVQQFYTVATTYPFQRSQDFEIYQFVRITNESYLELRSIPRDPLVEPVRNLITARKRGFFNSASQSNVRVMYSLLDGLNATTALTRWQWIGEAVTLDSWAWVHCIHFIFGLETCYSLVVLVLVTYQKVRTGKIWLGDPFASVSTVTLVARGIWVTISWSLDNFWSLNEYAMSTAAMLTGSQPIRVHKELVHADMMVIYLSLVGFVSAISRERIDPSVAIFWFEFVHYYRLSFLQSSPAVINKITTYSSAQYTIGIAKVTPVLASMSPMRLWSSFKFPGKDAMFLAASYFPTIYLVAGMLFFALFRKVYRRCYPEQTRQRSSQSTDTSGNEKTAMTMKGIVTNFEISTGAELQTRFGLISDYNNYVYFKGMKFASPDGVYCSGYVIVNGKYLVSTKHLLSIVLMKILHARYTNVYAYEVDGNSVKETARLVHTNTFLWSDLWRLNVTVLL
ncbi:unnamed protein product [Phytophthora fragariaefolia]|uniref:Unnamed protein product n=1 Tax=Phytophthora fragariaefolia TaxID=1490495 RepID=A0A9W6TTP6_9STRA|nr:unnamed protein product [Phytophthora fragariaefolia]